MSNKDSTTTFTYIYGCETCGRIYSGNNDKRVKKLFGLHKKRCVVATPPAVRIDEQLGKIANQYADASKNFNIHSYSVDDDGNNVGDLIRKGEITDKNIHKLKK